MTPGQETQCDLLGIEVCKMNDHYFVKRDNLTLIVDVKLPNYAPPTKLFSTVSEAIFSAGDPEKLGLRWGL